MEREAVSLSLTSNHLGKLQLGCFSVCLISVLILDRSRKHCLC